VADGGTPPVATAPGDPAPASTLAHARQPGIREVLLVAAAVVLTVFVAAGVTALLPRDAQALVFDTPLLIIVLIAGTAIVLWRILRTPGT
jgi:FtsH-binding integral membrane protein